MKISNLQRSASTNCGTTCPDYQYCAIKILFYPALHQVWIKIKISVFCVQCDELHSVQLLSLKYEIQLSILMFQKVKEEARYKIRQITEFWTGRQLLISRSLFKNRREFTFNIFSSLETKKGTFTPLKPSMGQCRSKFFMLWVRSLLVENIFQCFSRLMSANSETNIGNTMYKLLQYDL